MVTLETVPSFKIFDGKPGAISLILFLRFLIVSNGFAPFLATTTPPTASTPLLSNPPLRVAGPNCILATSFNLTGT